MNYDHATAADYDELLDCLNDSFSKPPEASFDKILPVMWRRTDKAMGKHLIIRDGKTIAAVVGVYPLDVVIGKHNLLFTTIGNVGTRAQYRCKHYMKTLFTASVAEAKAMGAVAGRLGGQRQRYNRYGFDIAARSFNFTLTRKNIAAYYDGSFTKGESYTPALSFRKIEREDREAIAFAQSLQSAEFMHVNRGDLDSFYDVMTAWQLVPYIAEDKDGKPVGYLSANPAKNGIAEHCAATPELHYQMLLDWLTAAEDVNAVAFPTMPWNKELNQKLTRICESWSVTSPTRIIVFDFLKLAKALLDARIQTLAPAPEGTFILRIDGDDMEPITLKFANGTVDATDEPPMLTLDRLAATRLLFGDLPPTAIAPIPEQASAYVSALLPLPLAWNNQDRV